MRLQAVRRLFVDRTRTRLAVVVAFAVNGDVTRDRFCSPGDLSRGLWHGGCVAALGFDLRLRGCAVCFSFCFCFFVFVLLGVVLLVMTWGLVLRHNFWFGGCSDMFGADGFRLRLLVLLFA